MTEHSSPSSGNSALRPRARLLRTLGDELISSETVALVELVKNSYDADATRVLIRFGEPVEVGHGELEVIDNGCGMSVDTIINTWMEPATLFRKRQHRSVKFGRRVLGEKGIGRFAASRLANHLEVITRHVNSDNEVRIYLDWSQFDDEDKYLDQIVVPWEETQPRDICPEGTIEQLWQGERLPIGTEILHGTILRMRELRTSWSEPQFDRLRIDLARLVSPIFEEKNESLQKDFQIHLELPEQYSHLSGTVEPPELLKRPHYLLNGRLDENGSYKLRLRIDKNDKDSEQLLEGQFLVSGDRTPSCGPFSIELRVWDRDKLREIADFYDSSDAQIRRDLDNVAGINVYRDGFRVYPYGEQGDDWLHLDARRVQNPTLRLSNNQIVGYVGISADLNPNLRDQSNREGLIAGQAYDDLREMVKAVLAKLETERWKVRPRREDTEQPQLGLFSGFDLGEIRKFVQSNLPNDLALMELLGEKEKDLTRRVNEVQFTLSRYRRLATLGQLIDMVLHDGRTPLTKIRNQAKLALREITRTEHLDTLARSLHGRFEAIASHASTLASIFRKIEPLSGRKRGRPQQARLEQIIQDAVSMLDEEIRRHGAHVELPTTQTMVTVDPAEIQTVLVNLLQNSIYWLGKVSREQRRIVILVKRNPANEVEITVSDSGPGVSPELREVIFDPYFSTKSNGVGLGLTIAGEIVSDYYDGSLELIDKGPLPGATFRLTLRRRI